MKKSINVKNLNNNMVGLNFNPDSCIFITSQAVNANQFNPSVPDTGNLTTHNLLFDTDSQTLIWVDTKTNLIVQEVGTGTNGWVCDDFVTNAANAPGQSIVFATSVANGGNVASTPTNLDALDVNGTVNKSRYGLQTMSIPASGAISRSHMQSPTNTRFQIQPTTVVGFGADIAFNGGQIDFANDPVYQHVGFLNAGATSPNQGAYIRPPYVGETDFYKYCLTYFDSGTSTPVRLTFDSPVPYDPTNNRFLSFFILVDAPNDSITYTIKENGNTHKFTINDVQATYPDMWSGSIINMMYVGVSRVSLPAVSAVRSIVVDKVYRYIKPNYNY